MFAHTHDIYWQFQSVVIAEFQLIALFIKQARGVASNSDPRIQLLIRLTGRLMIDAFLVKDVNLRRDSGTSIDSKFVTNS